VADGHLGSWRSDAFVEAWASDDVAAPMLELPQRISTALVRDAGIDVGQVVDIGAGEGPYLAHLLREFPDATGTWIDLSDAMLARARVALGPFGDRVEYVVAAAEELAGTPIRPAQVVVSSRALHHVTADALQAVYRQVRALVTPGGFFFNLDHVQSGDDWTPRYRRIRHELTGARRTPLASHGRPERFHDLGEQLAWLEAAGFAAVDVPWRTLHTALLAARA
jgi:ubiquinone/menaquinone biosynthesis C-methylase UbiE